MLDEKNDQNRLLVATFIVATFIASLQIQFKSDNLSNHYFVLLLGAPMVGLMASALFAFLFVMSKGYELRYKHKGTANFIDNWNFVLYNISILIFAPTILLIGFLYICGIFYPRAIAGDSQAVTVIYVLSLTLILLTYAKPIWNMAKKAFNKKANKNAADSTPPKT